MSGAVAGGGVLSRLSAPVRESAPTEPTWRSAGRRSALAWVAEHGFPTRKDEDWRYTKLAPILDTAFEPAGVQAGSRVSAELIQARSVDLGGPLLVFVNGHYSPALSRCTGLPQGVTVSSLAQALSTHAQRLEPVLSHPSPPDAFTAFNDALAADGAYVHLAAGTELIAPIHLVFVADSGGATLMSNPRSVVLADAGSRACIVESYIGFNADVHCTNAVTDVRLAEDAQIEHYKVQNEPESAFHLARLDVRQEQGSQFESHTVLLGGRIGRQEVRALLAGEGARVSLDGLYLPRGEQVHDNTIFVDHASPNCASNQLYKGVLDGRGRGVFNGHILVRPGADGTDANQKNKNLVLSDRAEADTRPRLEIYADDVQCTHGAAVGQLDDEALLYLRSRGLAYHEARGLLVNAFIGEMVDRITLPLLREHVLSLLSERAEA